MHCLPAYREGDHGRCDRRPELSVLDEAENRLHVQKAIMAFDVLSS